MIDPNDKSHPRNHPCARCGAAPGELCRTKTGLLIAMYRGLHASRHAQAQEWLAPRRRE